MDVYGIEVLLGLPKSRVFDQVILPKRLDLHLERRANYIICPQCRACCSRALPIEKMKRKAVEN